MSLPSSGRGEAVESLERSTNAALDAILQQHREKATRDGLKFALALQTLKFGKMHPDLAGLQDTPDALLAARVAYCDKIREKYSAGEALCVESLTRARGQDPASRRLGELGRPATSVRLSGIIQDLGAQDVGQHAEMCQALLQAQVEDNADDQRRNLSGLSRRIAEAYASHKYQIK